MFQSLDLEIPAGGLTTLIGSSGSGKTTIIDLTTGLLQPQEGEVLLDGTPLREVDIRSWRGMIGYVPGFAMAARNASSQAAHSRQIAG